MDTTALLETALVDAQAHYGKQFVSIADAANLFFAQRTQETALPFLLLTTALFKKHARAFETHLMDQVDDVTVDVMGIDGLMRERLPEACAAHFATLPER